MLWLDTSSRILSVAAAVAGLLIHQASARPATESNDNRPPSGFVTTKGTKFQLDGKDFYFAGSNAYYFPFDNVRPPIFSSRLD